MQLGVANDVVKPRGNRETGGNRGQTTVVSKTNLPPLARSAFAACLTCLV